MSKGDLDIAIDQIDIDFETAIAMPITANDPTLRSWVDVPAGSDFPIQNLPFGIFQAEGKAPRVCSAIGDYVIDLVTLAERGFFNDLDFDKNVFQQLFLNDFIALGKEKTRRVRDRLAAILDADRTEWDAGELKEMFLYSRQTVTMRLPVKVGDYTDFYSSLEHATNVGKLFRDPENALLPNWRYLPVGYHGRASSIVVSGAPIYRPNGQLKPEGVDAPYFGPTQALDFELETAFVIGRETELGSSISTAQAEDYIFGLCLFNDWSARDIQRWEYVPLGPFLGKSFASTISPWIVTLDALEPFRVSGPEQKPAVLPYLQYEGQKHYDIQLEVRIEPENGGTQTVCRTNFKYLYWNMCQQLAHHTSNGCNVKVGDLMASGTISGPEPGTYGSLLEITRQGKEPLAMPDGSTRRFLQDGDRVVLSGWCEKKGRRIGFGEAAGRIIGTFTP